MTTTWSPSPGTKRQGSSVAEVWGADGYRRPTPGSLPSVPKSSGSGWYPLRGMYFRLFDTRLCGTPKARRGIRKQPLGCLFLVGACVRRDEAPRLWRAPGRPAKPAVSAARFGDMTLGGDASCDPPGVS